MATKVSLIPFVNEFENFLEQILERLDIEEIWERLEELEENLGTHDEMLIEAGKRLSRLEAKSSDLEARIINLEEGNDC